MIYKKIELPDNLRPQAIKFVKDIINTFDRENKLNGLDTMALYLLANNMDVYLQCEEDIRKNGLTVITDRGNTAIAPSVTIMKTTQTQISVLLKELGLTLGSRNKLKAIETVTEESPLAAFIKKNK